MIIKPLPHCCVIISKPIIRTDDGLALLIIKKLNKHLSQLELPCIENDNIKENDLGRKGLHLNKQGTGKFANNLLDAIRKLWYYEETLGELNISAPSSAISEKNESVRTLESTSKIFTSSLICVDENEQILQLQKLKTENPLKIIFGHLNINSLRNKFEQLVDILNGSIDILMISETKIDDTFPTSQFLIEGFSEPYRLDWTSNGGGMMLFVRSHIPSKLW